MDSESTPMSLGEPCDLSPTHRLLVPQDTRVDRRFSTGVVDSPDGSHHYHHQHYHQHHQQHNQQHNQQHHDYDNMQEQTLNQSTGLNLLRVGISRNVDDQTIMKREIMNNSVKYDDNAVIKSTQSLHSVSYSKNEDILESYEGIGSLQDTVMQEPCDLSPYSNYSYSSQEEQSPAVQSTPLNLQQVSD